jgi:hypothetical protein
MNEKSIPQQDNLYVIPTGVSTRWASPENPDAAKSNSCINDDGRKRAESFSLASGHSRTLLNLSETSGTIRRIWITIDDRSPKMLRGIKLQAYWDGESSPAISCPLGDFFSNGLGEMATFQSSLFASPEGRSFNCYIPMPFRKGAKIVVKNESDTDLSMFYYDINCTIGEDHPAEMAYFHSYWKRENPTQLKQDYEILPLVKGRGRFLGCNIGVIADTVVYFSTWWGEGEVKMYIDGDSDYPTLCGTGTEDYIGSGWGLGQFTTPYHGCTVADHKKFHYCFYRLHIPDPVWFQNDIRVTIQQLGYTNIHTLQQLNTSGLELRHGDSAVNIPDLIKEKEDGSLFERQDDWSSCTWFYLDTPENVLPELAPVSDRVAGLN